MKALVIRSPWIDLILQGKKTWEMRGQCTRQRGRIALIKAGSGKIFGTAELIECLPGLSPEQLAETAKFHCIPEAQFGLALDNGWTIPWVLRNVERLERPVPYDHPNGAVTWVNLPDDILSNQPSTSASEEVSTSSTYPASPVATRGTAKAPVITAGSASWVDIPLTAGNIRNHHFYLRSAERLLPSDSIGGSNQSMRGKPVRIRFEPGMSVETDVAGDKMIFRCRQQVRDFFERTGAREGDVVRMTRTGAREFVVTIASKS